MITAANFYFVSGLGSKKMESSGGGFEPLITPNPVRSVYHRRICLRVSQSIKFFQPNAIVKRLGVWQASS